MGQGQAGKESALKETRPRIQSAPLSLIHPQTENRYRQPAVTPSHLSDSSQHNSTKGIGISMEQGTVKWFNDAKGYGCGCTRLCRKDG